MPSHVIAALQQQLATPPAAAASGAPLTPYDPHQQQQQQQEVLSLPSVRAALRLARYSLSRCAAVQGLMVRLASVPESFEMARATGLTLDQVSGFRGKCARV